MSLYRGCFSGLFCLTLGCASAGNTPSDSDGGGQADSANIADAGGDRDADFSGAPDAAPKDAPSPDSRETQPASLLITEVVDADLIGGVPKFVEVSNLGGETAQLSDYSFGVYNNGSTSLALGSTAPMVGQLGAGESYVISLEVGALPGDSTFFEVYGFDADQIEAQRQINGDDAVVLFHLGQKSDSYGVVGVDGSGEAWEYQDGFAERLAGQVLPSETFVVGQWSISGVNGLAGADAQSVAAQTSPGQH